ncbi:MAG: penicillin acylase family protein [Thermoleophilaceae bacterium]|nr:penicillin acylase family protein [Thermoleophilaceae bacterium]
MGRSLKSVVVALAALMLVPATSLAAGDVARYILPPGNYGGLPFTNESTDQLPLYDGLTPLRRNVSLTDVNRLFLPENFKPVGKTTTIDTGRKGTRLVYDEYGVPHVYGKTRADVAFGAGWSTGRDRALLIQLGRWPARVAVADVPGIDAFGLVTSGQQFVPSPQAEALVTKQRKLIVKRFGSKGRQILRDAQAYADGLNAYAKSINDPQPPATINDVIAVTGFIGSIFGAGGGGEARNSDLLAKLQQGLGKVRGYRVWDDVMLAEDPEAPTTIRRRFNYPPLTGGRVTGSVTVDPGSVQAFDPLAPGTSSASVNAASAPPRKQASNFLVASPQRSRTGNSLAVMGPQLGYYYPEIVQQMDLHGPGMNAQGVAVPGLAMYILIGRTKNYAWSLTSAGHDVRDVFAEKLCNPNGSAPTRASTHYVYKGRCIALKDFDAGQLNGKALKYKTSVHGPVIGTATVGGKPYALARKRSTFGRDGLNLAALHDLTAGKASTPKKFWKTANQFEFTFNWAYASRKATAYFTSGRLPKRARGLDRRLPTLGNGKYEWKGFLSGREHPHDVSGPGGLLLNWNNQSAPGFMHGDDEPYGSVHRVELFDQWPKRPRITDDVGIMNRAATEDVRSPAWPVVSKVLHGGPAPNARAAQVVSILDDWVRRDAPRLDADDNGQYDEPGPAIMDATWQLLAKAVMRPVLGETLLSAVDNARGLGGLSGESYVDKDLRTLLGRKVAGRFNVRYCGKGSLTACRASLWAAVDEAAAGLATRLGPDPAKWLVTAGRTTFAPGLLPNTIRGTNRPTFQQVLEFQNR